MKILARKVLRAEFHVKLIIKLVLWKAE